MSFQRKTISFLSVLACVPAAYAVTARPSVIGTASSRMPTMTTYISQSGTTTSGNTTASTLLANTECIDAYTSCMKGADACGSNFEECTTNVLFHGKMPQCLSTLAQCSTAGVQSLFGTGNVSALSNIKTKNTYGEVTEYTYPTDGSVLGQLIVGAAISNKYDTSTCVKRYTSCLKKDSVCGADFELCTTSSEFRKQRVYCDSTLARCQSEGLIELFGSTNTTTTPASSSRIGEMIAEGAALAAVNAVSTCYKVVDQCILNACTTNPYKCYENSSKSIVDIVEAINSGSGVLSTDTAATAMDTIAKANISGYIKNSCLDTIGGNKYCYATFLGEGQMPTSSQLKDEDNQEEVFAEAYSARMNSSMKSKIEDLVNQFDTKAKSKCTETIKKCVMGVCGSGSGAACYSQVFSHRDKSINNSASYEEIKTGCSAVVNTDAYCKYAAANPTSAGSYSYTYINNDAFDILFPAYDDGGNDPIGVVASLNASLASSYSDAAIAQMKRQCQAVATSCVKSMCGTDYQNCYRNRTDVYSSLTDTGESTFDKSMNKVGGVLDYTIVLGLCLDTVKNASVCEEHLAIERNRLKMSNNTSTNSWGGASSTRDGWIDAGSATKVVGENAIQATDENGNQLCTAKGGSDQRTCYSVDAAGNIYDQPVIIGYDTYVQSQAASTLFKDLIYDLEKEAQAKYNAKLTKQQNMCMSSNNGGVMGNKDTGSTFMWVKLKSQKVPASYPTMGLQSNQFAASNDIYNSFCRVRITLQSDDKKIQDVISKGTSWSTAYFAAGDSFTCGSWIPGTALEQLAQAVADDARSDAGRGNGRTRGWLTALGTVAGGGLGAYGGSKLADSSFLGGLTGNGTVKNSVESAEECVNYGNRYFSATDSTKKRSYVTKMLTSARKINTNKAPKGIEKQQLQEAIAELTDAMQSNNMLSSSYSSGDSSDNCSVRAYASVKSAGTNEAVVEFYCKDADKEPGADHICKNGDANKNYSTDSSSYGHTWVVMKCNSGRVSLEQMRDRLKETYNDKTNLPFDGTSITMYYNSSSASTNGGNAELDKAVNNLSAQCQLWNDDSAGQKTKSISTAVGAGVGAVAGGVLAYQATKSVQDAKLDKVEKEAYDEWMNEVGNHIRCYVGGDEVGMYGDIISTSME